MTTGFFDDLKVNTLNSVLMNAGSKTTLTYTIQNNGVDMDLSGTTCTWLMSPFGTPNYVVLTKTGSLVASPNNQFNITLLSTDTSALSGKYICQPVVTTVGGDD